MLTERRFDAGAVALNYAEGPAGGAPLVLLHGLSFRWQSWLRVLPFLTLRWHVFAPDLRGFGRSGRTPGAYRVTDYAADVVAFLRGAVGAPAAVAGQSLGAVVAATVAADAPELVRAAVLEEPPLGLFSDQPLRASPAYAAYRRLYELALAGPPLEEAAVAVAAAVPGLDAVEARSRAAALLARDPEALAFVLDDRAKEGLGLEARLARIACPVLLLQGNPARGGALDDARAARALGLLRRGTHVALPEAGHFLHQALPLEVARLLTDFLETV
jgi:pimeloyl-ACP methyl ester carboxylesterase